MFRIPSRAALLPLLLLLLAPGAPLATARAESEHIYGIHTLSNSAKFNGKSGYYAEYFSSSDRAAPPLRPAPPQPAAGGLTRIQRVDYRTGKTMPTIAAEQDQFADECARLVTAYKAQGFGIWSIGNEMNVSWEGSTPASAYVTGFTKVYRKMKAADPGCKVLVGPPGPWNNGGDTTYLRAIVNGIGEACDGYTIHAYGGRYNYTTRTLDMDPYDDDKGGFGVFKSQAEIIRQVSTTKPIYITEYNHVADGFSNASPPDQPYNTPAHDYVANFLPRGYQAVDEWNRANGYQIKALCWFTGLGLGQWQQWFLFSLDGLPQAAQDFDRMTATTDYRNSGAAPAGPAGLTGAVTSAAGGAPIARARIEVSGPTASTTTTSSLGVYALSGLTPGTYTLTCLATGFSTRVLADRDLAAGQTLNLDIALSPLGLPAGQGAIQGLVASRVGRPLAGIPVLLYLGADLAAESVTGPDGRYAFSGLSAGSYRILAQGSAGQTAEGQAVCDGAAVVPCDLVMPDAPAPRGCGCAARPGSGPGAGAGLVLALILPAAFRRRGVRSGKREVA